MSKDTTTVKQHRVLEWAIGIVALRMIAYHILAVRDKVFLDCLFQRHVVSFRDWVHIFNFSKIFFFFLDKKKKKLLLIFYKPLDRPLFH